MAHTRQKKATLRATQLQGYVIEQLSNTAQVYLGTKFFRVGDFVTFDEADQLCHLNDLDVTIKSKIP